MKKAVLRYGLYSGLFILVLFSLEMFVFKSFGQTEIAGYTAIVLSLCFVYFGLRYYRDKQNGGVLSFGQGLKLGMLITLIPSACFGFFDVIYSNVINPHFYDNYTEKMIAGLKKTAPADKFEAQAAAVRAQMKFWSQPWADFLLMFLTVAIVGLIITILATFMLKKKAVTQPVPSFA